MSVGLYSLFTPRIARHGQKNVNSRLRFFFLLALSLDFPPPWFFPIRPFKTSRLSFLSVPQVFPVTSQGVQLFESPSAPPLPLSLLFFRKPWIFPPLSNAAFQHSLPTNPFCSVTLPLRLIRFQGSARNYPAQLSNIFTFQVLLCRPHLSSLLPLV